MNRASEEECDVYHIGTGSRPKHAARGGSLE